MYFVACRVAPARPGQRSTRGFVNGMTTKERAAYIVRARLTPAVAERVTASAVQSGMTVSRYIGVLLEREVSAPVSTASKIDVLAVDDSQLTRFNLALSKQHVDALDSLARAQGLTRSKYVASLIATHLQSEPIYDRDQLALVGRAIDKVHANAVALNVIRKLLQEQNTPPNSQVVAAVERAESTCRDLLGQLNTMQASNVRRWEAA